jgi:hypothetical protein
MHPTEILEWLFLRVSFIEKYKSRVKTVRIYNTFEEYFGKNYHRIYLNIETDAALYFNLDNELTPEERESNEIVTFTQSQDYVSFYEGYNTEKEVEVNYDWVVALFNKAFRKKTFRFEEKRFVTESEREYERKRKRETSESEEYFKIHKPIADLGDILLAKTSWRGEKLFEVEKNTESIDRPFSGRELKMDLTTGLKQVNWVGKEDIHCIVTRAQLKELIEKRIISNKRDLLDYLKSGKKKELRIKFTR